MTTRIEFPPVIRTGKKYLPAFGGREPLFDATILNTRVYLQMIEIEFPTVVDAILYNNGAAAAGNVTVGIYSSITEDTPVGGTLLATSASTAVAGTFNIQAISLTSSVTLAPAQYWIAIAWSSATTTPVANGNYNAPSHVITRFDQAYGALPATCPACTALVTNITLLVRRT